MNTIPHDQLQDRHLEYLAAREEFFLRSKTIQAAQVILSFASAIGGAILIVFLPATQVYVAFWGIVVTLLDIAWLTPWRKKLQEKGAKSQELFDCEVLGLKWKDFKMGRLLDIETLTEAASAYRRKDPNHSALKNWYPPVVGNIPMEYARIICQRQNLRWDVELRRTLANYILVAMGGTTLLVFLLGLVGSFTLEKLILAVLNPLLPVLVVGMRLYVDHSEAVHNIERLREYADTLWDHAIKGRITTQELEEGSRDLQDEIYNNRRARVPVFEWFYRVNRKKHTSQMNRGAEVMVEEYQKNITP